MERCDEEIVSLKCTKGNGTIVRPGAAFNLNKILEEKGDYNDN